MMSQTYLQYPEIDPIAISIGPINVYWYGLMYLLGFLFANWMGNRQAAKPGSSWDKEEVGDLLFYGFLGVILGGRIGYVLFYNFSLFLDDPMYLFRITDGGMSFHGGLIGVLLAFAYFGRKTQRSFFVIADFIAPMVPFGLAAGRIGNFINGELWGRVTDVPWAMIFPTGGDLPRHPSQLYQFAMEGVLLLIILQVFARKPRPVGAISGLFLFGYGIFRFVAEYFRQPDSQLGLYFDLISMGQILSTPMIFLGALIMFIAYKKPTLFAGKRSA